MTLPSGTKLGRYEIRSKIGAGGMGEVFLAEDVKLRRNVALKVLPEAIARDAERLRRFEQEALAASALNHPGILTIYEFGEDGSTHFLASEFVEGQSLRKIIELKDGLKLTAVLDISIQIAEALAASHEAGIVHRDIKPENVMIRRDGYVKVLDFGLAKLTERAEAPNAASEDETRALVRTAPGVVMGTAAYMSPEQARGRETDSRTDIWSLGAVLYEMLAGKLPFTGETVNHTIVSIIEKEPAPLTGVPDELQRIVRKALTKDAAMRYQTARDMLIDLKNLRRELDLQGELERTAAPNRATVADGVPAVSSGAADPTQDDQLAATATVTASASSLEYALNTARSHKFATLLVIAALVAVVAVAAYFTFRSPAQRPISSVAVLPLENRSGSPDSDYLSDGIAESLVYRLSQLPNLKVSPTSSVMRYRGKPVDVAQVARELEVDAVMSGRLAQRGDDLTISVELVDARSGKLIWGEQYERKMSELLSTQREIASTIVQKLEVKISGDAPQVAKRYTESNEAYQLYLRGRFYFARRTNEDIRRSIELFEQAVNIDPKFALGYVGIAESYVVMPSYPFMLPQKAYPPAKAAIAKALELDPDLPEAHTVAGMVAVSADLDWKKGEAEFKRALELNPNLAITHYRYAWMYLSPMGRHDEAVAEMRKAMELEPLSLVQGANFAGVLMYAGRFDEALEQAKRTYELDRTFLTGQSWLLHTNNAKGDSKETLRLIAGFYEKNGGNPWEIQRMIANAMAGNRSEAEAILAARRENEKKGYIQSYWTAAGYALLGNKDAAFAELEKSFRNRDWFLTRLKYDPFLISLRDDPRFADLIRRIGLPE